MVQLKDRRFGGLLQALHSAGSMFSEAPLAVDCGPFGAAVGGRCKTKPQQHC